MPDICKLEDHDSRKSTTRFVPLNDLQAITGKTVATEDNPEFFIRKTFESDPQKGCELLFTLYYQPLCNHAVRFVYSKEVAEDLVGDIFYTFWKTQSWQAVHLSYRAYLFRSVRNRAYNYLANELKKSDSIDLAIETEAALSDSPEQIMGMEELHQKIDDIVGSLSPQCRKVFIMNRFEGRKNKMIAEELGLSIRTVETHLFKAISLLRSGLKEHWLWTMFLFILTT